MTPAVAAAQRVGIPFTLHEYEHDPAASSYGMEAAEKTGVDPARVFTTLVDESALGHETIFMSAGRRGLELELAPGDLVRLTDARVAAVASGG